MNRMLGFDCVDGAWACATCIGALTPSMDAAASMVAPIRMLRRLRGTSFFRERRSARSSLELMPTSIRGSTGRPPARLCFNPAQLLPLWRRVELDFLNRAGERERSFRLVVRADLRDGISSDLERLDPLADHRRADGALACRLAVHEEPHCRASVQSAAWLQPLGGVLQLDGHVSTGELVLGLDLIVFEVG